MIMYLGSSLIFQWPVLLPGKCMRVFQLEMFLSSFPTLENCMLEWHTFEWPTNLCTCLWRPCNHSSLHAARPTVLPINCGGNTAPDLNSMLAWTHTEEGPDILQWKRVLRAHTQHVKSPHMPYQGLHRIKQEGCHDWPHPQAGHPLGNHPLPSCMHYWLPKQTHLNRC